MLEEKNPWQKVIHSNKTQDVNKISHIVKETPVSEVHHSISQTIKQSIIIDYMPPKSKVCSNALRHRGNKQVHHEKLQRGIISLYQQLFGCGLDHTMTFQINTDSHLSVMTMGDCTVFSGRYKGREGRFNHSLKTGCKFTWKSNCICMNAWPHRSLLWSCGETSWEVNQARGHQSNRLKPLSHESNLARFPC